MSSEKSDGEKGIRHIIDIARYEGDISGKAVAVHQRKPWWTESKL